MAQAFDPLAWTGRFVATGRPTLEAFLLSPAFARALIGPIAGGRKFAAAHAIRQLAGAHAMPGTAFSARTLQRRWRWLVVAPRHGETTARATWSRLTSDAEGRSVALWSKGGIPCCAVEYPAPGRPMIEAVFLDWEDRRHADRLLLGACSGVWLDQAADLPEAAFEAALSGLRANYWPSGLERRGPAKKLVIVTSRMPLIDHWIPRRFAAGGADYALFRQPGGRSPQAETAHLRAVGRDGAGYYRDAAEGMPADDVRRYIDAEYGVSAVLTQEAAEAREQIRRRLARLAAMPAPPNEQPAAAAA